MDSYINASEVTAVLDDKTLYLAELGRWLGYKAVRTTGQSLRQSADCGLERYISSATREKVQRRSVIQGRDSCCFAIDLSGKDYSQSSMSGGRKISHLQL
jgi:hypothetical protein